MSIIKKEGEKERKEGKKRKRDQNSTWTLQCLDVWQNRIIFSKDHEVYDAKKPKRVEMGSI